jgi:hypothetical protein
MQELKSCVNEILCGSIRSLLPSYWWKRLFNVVIDELSNKQDKLISGETIKTIGGKDILGPGNIDAGVIVNSVEELESLDMEIGAMASVISGGTVERSILNLSMSSDPDVWSVVQGISVNESILQYSGGDSMNMRFYTKSGDKWLMFIVDNDEIGVITQNYSIIYIRINGGSINKSGLDNLNKNYLSSGNYYFNPTESSSEEVLKVFDPYIKTLETAPFTSDAYIKEELGWKKLGVGSYSVDSEMSTESENLLPNNIITNTIIDNENVATAALHDLNDRLTSLEYNDALNLDSELSVTSTRGIQNRVVTGKIEELNSILCGKQDELVSGSNIKTINGVSIVGGGNISINADTSIVATREEFNELENIILENEEVYSASLVDLDARIKALETIAQLLK